MSSSSSLLFRDPVHGLVELSPAAQIVIQHVGFQRLYSIRQFACDFVFPHATYYRAQHSIAVANLAKYAVKAISAKTGYKVSERELLWVELIGLSHDSGHGPISHVLDDTIEEMRENGIISNPSAKLKHEERSIAMATWILKDVHIGLDDEDIQVIQFGIYPSFFENRPLPKLITPENKWLFEIVCNTIHGIDVDRLEYLIRDSSYYYKTQIQDGAQNGTKSLEMVNAIKDMLSRCALVNGHWCFDIEDSEFLQKLMLQRADLHLNFYGHVQVKACECMIKDVLIKYAPIINLGGIINLQTQDDFIAFSRLTDNVLEDILNSRQDYLKDCRQLIHNLCNTIHDKWYRHVGDFTDEKDIFEFKNQPDKFTICKWQINKVPKDSRQQNKSDETEKKEELDLTEKQSFMDFVLFHRDRNSIVRAKIPPSVTETLRSEIVYRVFQKQ